MENATISTLLSVLLLSSEKFIWAPETSMLVGFTYMQTIFITSIGGICGVSFFYFCGMWAMDKMELVNFKLDLKKFQKSNRSVPKKPIGVLKRQTCLLGLLY